MRCRQAHPKAAPDTTPPLLRSFSSKQLLLLCFIVHSALNRTRFGSLKNCRKAAVETQNETSLLQPCKSTTPSERKASDERLRRSSSSKGPGQRTLGVTRPEPKLECSSPKPAAEPLGCSDFAVSAFPQLQPGTCMSSSRATEATGCSCWWIHNISDPENFPTLGTTQNLQFAHWLLA